TCPYYEDKGLCKHIWATILAADRLRDGPRGRSRLELVAMDPEDYEQGDDDSRMDDDYDEPPRRQRQATSKTKSKRTKSPSKPKWQQQLTWNSADEEDDEAPPVLPGKMQREREIWYVLEALSGESINKPLLLLFHREARSTGKFGKLKPFTLS